MILPIQACIRWLRIIFLIDNSGAAFAPIVAGIISDAFDMGTAITWVSVSAWTLATLIFIGMMFVIDKDIARLRYALETRAKDQTQVQRV